MVRRRPSKNIRKAAKWIVAMSQHTDANRNDGCSRRLPPHASARSSFLKQSGATPKEVQMLQDLKNEVVFRLELAQREVDREHWRRQDSDHLHQREKRQRRSDADDSAQRHTSWRSKSPCTEVSQAEAFAAAQSKAAPRQGGYDRKRKQMWDSDHCQEKSNRYQRR